MDAPSLLTNVLAPVSLVYQDSFLLILLNSVADELTKFIMDSRQEKEKENIKRKIKK